MKHFIQDPKDSSSTYLLEVILDACENAELGGGTFAFASAHGAKLLFLDSSFQEFLKSNSFSLIVGVDAVTNKKALEALSEISTHYPNLSVRAFLSSVGGRSLYHPKFCWFKNSKGGILISGSGNLTGGGLRNNFEAFTLNKLDQPAYDEMLSSWDHFIASNTMNLHEITEEAILNKASNNIVIRPKQIPTAIEESKAAEEISVIQIDESDEIDEDIQNRLTSSDSLLIAEIPKASTRWNQANFSKEVFEDFFGATPGYQKRIFLYQIQQNGNLGEAEIRPSVSVKSRNFRFELEAASGLDYPTSGRPIGVFARCANRTFIYELLMPGKSGYKEISGFLDAQEEPSTKMRRKTFTVSVLQQAWPKSPILKRLISTNNK
jgi:hypothetical protein